MSLIYFYSNPFVWIALLAYFYSHRSKTCPCGVFLCFCFGLKLLVVLACYCALPIFFSPFIVLAQRPSSSLLSNPNQGAGAAGMIRAVRHALPAHKIGLFPSFPCNQFELIHKNAGKGSNIISYSAAHTLDSTHSSLFRTQTCDFSIGGQFLSYDCSS